MRVLVVHNRYRSTLPSGENRFVDAEIELLRRTGVDVRMMITSSDDIRGWRGLGEAAVGPVYAPSGVATFRRLVASARPDVVHLHNVFPLISPWVVRVAHAAGVPVVQTVHNHRHTCVNGLHFRDNRICNDCLGSRFPLPAVIHACYRGSRPASLAMATGQVVHRGTWTSVDRYLVLTELMAQHLKSTGVSEERIGFARGWCSDPGRTTPPGQDVLFVGRLDAQKGVPLLLDTWRHLDPLVDRRLVLAGDGPLAPEVRRAADGDARIRYLGRLDAEGVAEAMRASGVVAMPGTSYEGIPLTRTEALSHGRALLCADEGGAAATVPLGVGWKVPPTPTAWAAAVAAMSADSIAEAGRAARAYYRAECRPEIAVQSVLDCYQAVAAVRS